MINGSYFGEVDIILNRKRKFNAICESECELYYLPRFDYENVIERDFPHINEKLKNISLERDKKNKEALDAILKLLNEAKEHDEVRIDE